MLPIERSSFILLAQPAAAEWINSLPRDEGADSDPVTAEMLNSQPPVYLVDLFENPEAMDSCFQENWPKMWESWLASWCPEPDQWPQDRKLEEFGKWFQILPTPMVFDALTRGPGDIVKPNSGIVMP